MVSVFGVFRNARIDRARSASADDGHARGHGRRWISDGWNDGWHGWSDGLWGATKAAATPATGLSTAKAAATPATRISATGTTRAPTGAARASTGTTMAAKSARSARPGPFAFQ